MRTTIPELPRIISVTASGFRLLAALLCALAGTIESSAQVANPAAAPVPSGAQTGVSDQVVVMSPFELRETNEKGYAVTYGSGASRVVLPLELTPQSIIAINRQQIEDTGFFNMADAVRFVSGVTPASTPIDGQFTVRGQNLSGAQVRDGYPQSYAGAQFMDMANVERIEVIKGPDGALYGSQSIGGLVNVVSKMPLDHPFTELTFSTENSNGHDIVRVVADDTRPIDAAGHWRYRVIGSFSDGMNWLGGTYRRWLVDPILSYTGKSGFRAWVRLDYEAGDAGDEGSSWFADAHNQISFFLPRSEVADESWLDNGYIRRYADIGAEKSFFDGFLTSRLLVRPESSTAQVDQFLKQANITLYDRSGNLIGAYTNPAVNFNDPSQFGQILEQRAYYKTASQLTDVAFYLDNVIKLSIPHVVDQTLLAYAGYDRSRSYTPYIEASALLTPAFDALHPVYNGVWNPTGVPLNVTTSSYGYGSLLDWGVQDNFGFLGGRLFLVFGFRHDTVNSWSKNLLSRAFSMTYGEGVSRKVALIGQPVRGVSPFLNYSETFTPQFGTYFTPSLQELARQNQLGKMEEGGVKLDLFGSRLVSTTSAFDITQNNTLGTGPNVAGVSTQIPIGLVKTDGWESDVAYQPVPALSMVGGIGSLSSKTATGILARGVSQGLNYKAFAKYTLPVFFDRLAVGLGYSYTNKRAGNSADTFTLPAYGIWDALLSYTQDKWQVSLNVDNLTNTLYVEGAAQDYLIWPGASRTIEITFRYRP